MRLLLVAALVGALMLAGCSGEKAARVADLQPAEFAKLIGDKSVFVVDVHIPEQEHISGTDAVIPYNELQARASELPADRNTPIAVYCRSGSMSAEAAKTLQDMGYRNIYNLAGGRNAWVETGVEVTETRLEGKPSVTVYKSASCGCCSGYAGEMQEEGFRVETVNTADIAPVKRQRGVPAVMESCHTAVVDGYFVEGHVPAEAIDKLLAERPEVDGIALPGMPMGAPGMSGQKQGVFIVYAVKDGKYAEFMRL